jgi:hypothetical protein
MVEGGANAVSCDRPPRSTLPAMRSSICRHTNGFRSIQGAGIDPIGCKASHIIADFAAKQPSRVPVCLRANIMPINKLHANEREITKRYWPLRTLPVYFKSR